MNRMAEDFTQFEAVRRLERQFAAASSRAPARSSRRRLGWVGGGLATAAVALGLTPAGAAIRDAVGFGGSEATPVSCPKQIRIARAAGMKGSFVNECPSVARTREVAEEYERRAGRRGRRPTRPGLAGGRQHRLESRDGRELPPCDAGGDCRRQGSFSGGRRQRGGACGGRGAQVRHRLQTPLVARRDTRDDIRDHA